MTKNYLKIITLACLIFVQQSWGSTENCSRESFSKDQLENPYAPWTKKTLERYSGKGAEQIIIAIEKNVKYESNSVRRPCLAATQSCFGQDEAWTYQKEIIRDAFGNSLGLNGVVTSKQYDKWPANDLYYAHQTQVGYTCSWGGNLKAYCEKWCSLTVVDDRFHD